MPIYNFGYGNIVSPFNNGVYTQVYVNGMTSTTAMVNGMMYTQNMMMLGQTGSGCGDKPCSQGYSLYFPCLKNVTRGEDVCFEFYVVDNAGRDVVDLRKVDALTLNLTGNFGCPLGTFQYPGDYIKPLQTQEYKTVIDEGFAERETCILNVLSADTELDEIDESNMSGKVGRFFKGDLVRLEAFDTRSYIFVGWVDIDAEPDAECDDFIMSYDRVLSFNIEKDMNITAVYRKRNTYTIYVKDNNSFFTYYNNGEELPLKNRHKVTEGDHIIVRTVPFNCVFSKWNEDGLGVSPHTSVENVVMDIEVFSDITLSIEEMSGAEQVQDSDIDNYDLNMIGFSFYNLITLCGIEQPDEYVEHEVTENELPEGLVYHPEMDGAELFKTFVPDRYENLHYYTDGINGILRFGDSDANGYMEFLNPGIENETVVEIHCTKFDSSDCSVIVTLDGGESQTQEVYDGENILIFRFDNTDFKRMEIATIGEIFPVEKPASCLIDRIVVSDIEIVDKGKAALCLPGSITAKFHRGKIAVTGAVMIGGQTYGLPCTTAGTVNNNPIINTVII